MSNLRVLRRRIRSVRNMQKIFKAMEMVAAAKLRRAQNRALAARPYSEKISEMLANIARNAGDVDHPLFKPREVRTTALVLVTSDQGLAGAYNTNLMRAAEQRLRQAEGNNVLVVIGKKGRDYFRRRRHTVLVAHTPLPGEASLEFARKLTDDLIARYLAGEVDRVELMFTQFISALRRKIVVDPFVPIAPAKAGNDASASGATIFEPDAESILAELLPRYATAKMFAALADALASEQGARMIAMGAARKNAGELADAYSLQANRMRQASITKELLEIVAGAEALK